MGGMWSIFPGFFDYDRIQDEKANGQRVRLIRSSSEVLCAVALTVSVQASPGRRREYIRLNGPAGCKQKMSCYLKVSL